MDISPEDRTTISEIILMLECEHIFNRNYVDLTNQGTQGYQQ